jgi:hypothetical protein
MTTTPNLVSYLGLRACGGGSPPIFFPRGRLFTSATRLEALDDHEAARTQAPCGLWQGQATTGTQTTPH